MKLTELENYKKSIALGHLRIAMRLYKEECENHSVILLAAAAEEILGQLIKPPSERSKRNSSSYLIQNRVEAVKELADVFEGKPVDKKELLRQILSSKNTAKHFSGDDEPLSNPRRDAREWLLLAIDCLDELNNDLEPEVEEFQDSLRSEEWEEASILIEKIKNQGS